MVKLKTEEWMRTLDADHRALLKMVAERLTDPAEVAALGVLSLNALGQKYADLIRFELVKIPIGTMALPCRRCGKPTYWVPCRFEERFKEQISIAGNECRAPTETLPGVGFSHLSDCPRSVYRVDLTSSLHSGGRMAGCSRTSAPLRRGSQAHQPFSGATATIGPEGGSLVAREAGITIQIPAGALAEPTSLSLSPRLGVYGFEVSMSPPRMLNKRATVKIRLEERDLGIADNIVLGHEAANGEGFDEFYAVSQQGSTVTAHVPHFSGYLLSSGFACDPTVVTDGSCVYVDDNPT